MAGERAWMPIYWGDFLRDTMHLNAEQTGAYLLLIASYWCRGAPLPDDDRQLARVAKVSIFKWKGMVEILRPFFIISNGAWVHERLEYEILRSSERSASARASAYASAEQRARTSTVTGSKLVGNTELDIEDRSPNGEIVVSPKSQNDLHIIQTIAEAFDGWNHFAAEHDLPACQKRTTARRVAVRARLRDAGGIEGWRAALEKAAGVNWMFGDNKRGWRLNIDTLVRESFFVKLMEGAYDNRDPPSGGELFDKLARGIE